MLSLLAGTLFLLLAQVSEYCSKISTSTHISKCLLSICHGPSTVLDTEETPLKKTHVCVLKELTIWVGVLQQNLLQWPKCIKTALPGV